MLDKFIYLGYPHSNIARTIFSPINVKHIQLLTSNSMLIIIFIRSDVKSALCT